MPPIYLVFALAILNFATTQASRVLLALYALDFGAAPFAVGAISATYSAFPMLLAWVAGRIADRHGSRWPLAVGALVCGCGMSVPYLAPGLPALFVAAALNGLSFTFYTVALQNLVGIMGDADGRARRYSNYAMVVSFASFLGPLISGFSIDHLGFATTCLLVAVLGLVPLALLVSCGGMLPGGRAAAGPAESVRGILTDRAVRRILLTSSLVVTGTDIFQFYLPIYGHAIGLSASSIGIVLAMFAAASVVVRFLLPWFLERLSPEQMLSYSFCLGAASFFLLPFFDNAVTLSLISFLMGLGLGCGTPITLMLTYSQSPPGRSGEALGLRMTANHLARVIGPLVFGSIGSAFGLFPVFWINGAMLASGGMLSGRGAGLPRGESSPRG